MKSTSMFAALAGFGLAAGTAFGVTTFPITMSGAQEVPGPGDPDGSATGTLTIDPATNTISWNITYSGIATPLTGFHIHPGAAGAMGGIFVSLGTATTGGAGTLISSVVTSAANIAAVLANPTAFYVNVHNGPFGAGALRGQIPAVFNVKLRGSQEVPGPGDPDGLATGTIAFDTGTNMVSWDIAYSGIDTPLTGFHIHPGAAGVAGGIFLGLGVATTGGPGTLISSTAATPAQISAVLANPTRFYINIHNGPFGPGAIRGQIKRTADLDGDGDTDGLDLASLLAVWTGAAMYAPCPPIRPADFNGDCMVNGTDLAMLLADWAP